MASLLVVGVTARLGFWQLSRAAEKQAWQTAMTMQRALPVVNLSEQGLQNWGQTQWLHRRVIARGTWLPQFNVFLDNRQMDGRVGFFLLTPLQLENTPQAVWVQRGWLPRNFQERDQLPAIATPSGVVSLTARVALAPSKLLELGAPAPTKGFAHLRQNLDEAALQRETGLNLLSGSLVQLSAESQEGGEAPPDDGLLRHWFEPGADMAKHQGYALQWFGMSVLAAAGFLWFAFFKVGRS